MKSSLATRLLAIAIRNFADNNGVFQWKPVKLTMQCFPNDGCDVVPLLQELIETRQVFLS